MNVCRFLRVIDRSRQKKMNKRSRWAAYDNTQSGGTADGLANDTSQKILMILITFSGFTFHELTSPRKCAKVKLLNTNITLLSCFVQF